MQSRAHFPLTGWLWLGWLSLGLLASACDRDETSREPAASRDLAPSKSPEPTKSETFDTADGGAPATARLALPSGPLLAILAGQGVGSIRLGATVSTIERLMERPCDVVTDTVCRYIDRAVEFELEDGVTRAVVVHRAGRPAGKDGAGKERVYGVFNGAIPPDLVPGMLPQAIIQYLGKPERLERGGADNAFRNVERHHYPGMLLSYDRLPNGKLALGEVRIEKPHPSQSPKVLD
jgi:hypothetical protein